MGFTKSKKIDRPLVKMTNSDDESDFEWYNTMLGRQNQIIILLENSVESLENIVSSQERSIDILQSLNKQYKIENDEYRDKYKHKFIIIQFKNLFKRRKKWKNPK